MRFGTILVAAAALVCAGKADAATWLRYEFTGTGVLTATLPGAPDFKPIVQPDYKVRFSIIFDADRFPTSTFSNPMPGASTSISATPTGVSGSGSYIDGRAISSFFTFDITTPNAPTTSFASIVTGPASGILNYAVLFPYVDNTRPTRNDYAVNITRVTVTNAPPPGTFDTPFFFTAVPEPATWTMMMAGVAAVGFALRRRKPRAAPLLAIAASA